MHVKVRVIGGLHRPVGILSHLLLRKLSSEMSFGQTIFFLTDKLFTYLLRLHYAMWRVTAGDRKLTTNFRKI